MNDTRRRRRTFQPSINPLESRVVLNAAAAVQAVHAEAAQVREQRHLKHELKVELQREKIALRKNLRVVRHDETVRAVALTNPGAMSVAVGTASQATLSKSSSGAASKTALQVHVLAPNNLDAANIALEGMPDGVAVVGTVISHGRPGPVPKTTPTGTGVTVGSTGITGTTIGSTGIPTINLPTTPGSTFTNTSGGTIPGSGGVTFTNLGSLSTLGSTTVSSSGLGNTSTNSTSLSNLVTNPSTLSNIVTNALANTGVSPTLGTSVSNAILSAATSSLASGTPSTLSTIVANALTNTGLTSSLGTTVANTIVNDVVGLASGTTPLANTVTNPSTLSSIVTNPTTMNSIVTSALTNTGVSSVVGMSVANAILGVASSGLASVSPSTLTSVVTNVLTNSGVNSSAATSLANTILNDVTSLANGSSNPIT